MTYHIWLILPVLWSARGLKNPFSLVLLPPTFFPRNSKFNPIDIPLFSPPWFSPIIFLRSTDCYGSCPTKVKRSLLAVLCLQREVYGQVFDPPRSGRISDHYLQAWCPYVRLINENTLQCYNKTHYNANTTAQNRTWWVTKFVRLLFSLHGKHEQNKNIEYFTTKFQSLCLAYLNGCKGFSFLADVVGNWLKNESGVY